MSKISKSKKNKKERIETEYSLSKGSQNPLIYLSKLVFNPNSMEMYKMLRNHALIHRDLNFNFEQGIKTGEKPKAPFQGRILYRVEEDVLGEAPFMLAQSPFKPNFEYWEKKALIQDHGIKTFRYPLFLKGDMYRFCVLGNTIKKRNQKEHVLYDEQEQIKWLSLQL